MRPRQGVGYGEADTARAAAQVEHAPVAPAPLEEGYRLPGQHLRVRARDEHLGAHLHRQAAELPHAGYVGHRLAGEAAGEHLPDAALDLVGAVEREVAQQLRRRLAGGGGDNQPRLHVRRLNPGGAQRVAHGNIQFAVSARHENPPGMSPRLSVMPLRYKLRSA